jgi:murein DD-endopeptidase MepM/ murein hydrolase activator NlpD
MLITLLGVATVGLFSYAPAQHMVSVLFNRADESFITYRLLSERDALLAANLRLQEELDDLKAKAVPAGNTFEASVRAQLEELQGIIAAATELDLGEDGPTVARKGKKGKEREEVASSRKPLERRTGASSNHSAMGGREVECENGRACAGIIRKRNISLEIGPSFYAPERQPEEPTDQDPYSPTEQDLMRRLKTLSQGLRALPVGYPVEGDVTSHFGYRVSPFSRRASFHEGMDISLPRGGDVVATGDGVVTEAKFDGAYGWLVDVEHSPSVVSRYAHLSKTLVKVGQNVRRGDRIALSGNSGRSTGPHLHYEVRINGRARNPKQFVLLPQRLATVF